MKFSNASSAMKSDKNMLYVSLSKTGILKSHSPGPEDKKISDAYKPVTSVIKEVLSVSTDP